jgi:hypothetical protein
MGQHNIKAEMLSQVQAITVGVVAGQTEVYWDKDVGHKNVNLLHLKVQGVWR